MRIFVCWPPQIPSYFNAGHHLPVFSIAAYLRGHGHSVDALDAGALNCHWKEFGDRLYRGAYDVVVLVNDFDVVEGVRRAADYTRALLPKAMIITVGRLSYQVEGFFRKLDLDAIVSSGDYEAGTVAAIHWLARGASCTEQLPGVSLRFGSEWRDPSGPGRVSPADEWVLPDVAEIPYAAYERMYACDQNKFCGIPERRELVVPVARGCPIGCSFCDVPAMQGLRERRLSVERTISYILQSFARLPFEYVAFYAPTFTLDRRWVHQLCITLKTQSRPYPWKCATTLHHLDEELIDSMGASGCQRISVGVETFEPAAAEQLPQVKKRPYDRFKEVAAWCKRAGIELNCFVIVGLPGTTPKGAREAMEVISAADARSRPTLYTPYHLLRPEMTEREVSAFNRHLFIDSDAVRLTGVDPGEFLDLIFRRDTYVTPSTARVPAVPAR